MLGPGTLMGPWPRAPKRHGPKAGPGPGENLLVCWARTQASVGQTDPISESTIQLIMLAANSLQRPPSYGPLQPSPRVDYSKIQDFKISRFRDLEIVKS